MLVEVKSFLDVGLAVSLQTEDPRVGVTVGLTGLGVLTGRETDTGCAADTEREADILRALGHPIRLAIVEELSAAEECVCHLSHLLERPQPYISKQLAELREVGLVLDRREGPRTYYRLTDDKVLGVIAALRALSGRKAPAARRRVAGCPCPACAASSCCAEPDRVAE